MRAEQLGLSDRRQRRGEGEHEQHEPEREERDPPGGHGATPARERARANAVGHREHGDGRQLQRVERPARQEREAEHAPTVDSNRSVQLFHYHLATSRVRRARGAVRRRARLPARRPLRRARGRTDRRRAGARLGRARPARLPAPADRAGARRRQRRRAARAAGSRRSSTTSACWPAQAELELVLGRAAASGSLVQERNGRRTFVATGAGYRLELRTDLACARRAVRGPARRRGPRRRLQPPSARSSTSSRSAARSGSAAASSASSRRAVRAPTLRRGAHRERRRRTRARAVGGAHVRRCGRLARDRRRRRRSPASGRRVDRSHGLRRLRRASIRSTSDRLLAASMDSIGTKPIVARHRGALRACGADMAAHCINDVITTGADPLFLLDYVAASRIDLEQVAELVEGAAEVCRAAGVALVGGETAELPGRLPRGRARLRGDVRRHRRARPPDRRLGRARGRCRRRASLGRASTRTASPSRGACSSSRTTTGRTCSRRRALYLDDVRRLRDRAHAFAHVTGGGIEGQSAPRPAGRPARTNRLGRLGAATCLRLARAPRRRGGAAPRLQPRHRLLRGARRSPASERVIGTIVAA